MKCLRAATLHNTRLSITIASALLLMGCGTPETNARLGGVRSDEASEIARLVRAQTSKPILSYERDRDDGSIHIWTRGDDPVYPERYTARRVGNHWKIEHDVMMF